MIQRTCPVVVCSADPEVVAGLTPVVGLDVRSEKNPKNLPCITLMQTCLMCVSVGDFPCEQSHTLLDCVGGTQWKFTAFEIGSCDIRYDRNESELDISSYFLSLSLRNF